MHQAIGEVVAAGPKSCHKTGTPVMYMQYGAFSDFKVVLCGLSGLSFPALDTSKSDFWDQIGIFLINTLLFYFGNSFFSENTLFYRFLQLSPI